jgi:glycosyltransferase involved in cell wall biosynthesis
MTNPRVIHISTTDVRGGAAKCAHRLHGALQSIGLRSGMLVAQRFTDEPDIFEYNPVAPAPAFLGRACFRVARRLQRPALQRADAFFSFDRALVGRRLLAQLPPCDVVNLHWVADLLDYRTLPGLAQRAPIVWTLHDMNPFTGGCHYSGACTGYTQACGSCPQLRTPGGPNDRTRRSLGRKRGVLRRIAPGRLAVVCPSRWLAGEARRSPAFADFDVTVIPSGIDTNQYRPVERAAARRRFNLPLTARIALFVADYIGDRRKGLGVLLPAIAALRDIPDLLFVTIGRGDMTQLADPIFRHLGPLSDGEALSAAYSAADAFVIPSLEDNFPNTVLEAMACATPVVGFASGGISEAVIDGQTGFLAPTGDGPALVPLLRRVLHDRRQQHSLALESRARVEREYNLPLQAQRYAGLYREMIGAREESGHAWDPAEGAMRR